MSGGYPDRIRQLPSYDGRFDGYRLDAKNCDVLFASYPPGTEIPNHVHDTDNHGVVTRGELILTMYGITRRVGVGQWYHVPENVVHAARFDIETDEIESSFHV
jgi:quercetin dioxygenase-like cupin family protein